MVLQSRILVFLWGAIFVTFLVKGPSLVDEYHMSRFIASSLFCFWGVLAVLPALKQIRLTTLDAVLFGFYALNLLSVSWADNFGEAIFTAQKYLILAVLCLVFRLAFEQNKVYRKKLFPIIIATAVVACLIPLAQIIEQLGAGGLGGKGVYAIIGHAGHKNLAASYLFLLLCFLLYWLPEFGRKFWYVALLILMMVVIFLLRSRAVYLAFGLLGLLMIAHLILSSDRSRGLVLKRVLPVLVGGFVLLVAGLQLTDQGKQYSKYLNPATYLQTASANERLFVWSKTWNLLENRPITGYGAGNWKLFFPSQSIEGGFRLQEKNMVFTRVHNDFLEVAAEVGIPGLLLFVAIFAFGVFAAYHRYRRAKSQFRLRWVVLGGALLGYAVICFFDFPKERLEHLTALALLLALIYYQGASTQQAGWILESKNLRRGLLGLLLLLLTINLPVSYFRFIGDQASKIILTYRNTDQSDIIIEQVERANSIWYNVDPMVVPLSWYEGVSYYLKGDFASAKAPFGDAYEVNPYNFNVINNYASTLVNLQEYEAAIPFYLQALKINPRFEEGMFNLSFAYHQLGNYEEALIWVNKTTGNPEKKQVFLDNIQAAQKE